MNEEARKRLQRLRDALDDMSGISRPFGFGQPRPEPKVVPTQETLEYLERLIYPQFAHEVKYHVNLTRLTAGLTDHRTGAITSGGGETR
jgi:hypothetical protein